MNGASSQNAGAGPDPSPTRTKHGRWWAAALVLLLLCMALARVAAIAGYLPYTQHLDGVYFHVTAAGMIERGDLDPRFLR